MGKRPDRVEICSENGDRVFFGEGFHDEDFFLFLEVLVLDHALPQPVVGY